MKKKMQQPGNIMGLRIDTTGEEKKNTHTHSELGVGPIQGSFLKNKRKRQGKPTERNEEH